MTRIMQVFCTGNSCVAKNEFPLMMVEMDNKDILIFIHEEQGIVPETKTAANQNHWLKLFNVNIDRDFNEDVAMNATYRSLPVSS